MLAYFRACSNVAGAMHTQLVSQRVGVVLGEDKGIDERKVHGIG